MSASQSAIYNIPIFVYGELIMKDKQTPMTDSQLNEAAKLFKTLGQSARLSILRALMNGPLDVTGIVRATKLKQANVSRHLARLDEQRFVRGERNGNHIRYSIRDPKLYDLCHLMCERIALDAQEKSSENAAKRTTRK